MEPQYASRSREIPPSFPTPIALTGTFRFLSVMKSTSWPSSDGLSVRVATLKMSAPCAFARDALAHKLHRDGVDLKSWNERITRACLFRARVSSGLNARAERNSTSRYFACGKNRESNSRRFRSDKFLAPPSCGSRAVMINGVLRIDTLRSSRSTMSQRQSRRSSKRSGGWRIASANLKSAAEAITPTSIWRGFLIGRRVVIYLQVVQPGKSEACSFVACLRDDRN